MGLRIAWALLVATCVGCGDDDDDTTAGDGDADADVDGDADADADGDADADADGDADADADGDADLPNASAGCGAVGPVTGARQIEVGGETGDYIVSLPAAYDPEQPYPLGFGFHGYGRTHENCQDGDCWGFQDAMGDVAILVYIKSFTDGWDGEGDVRDRNAALFEAVLDVMEAEYCVDLDRVFVAGTSSGATFSNVLACRYGDRLLAAVPVAGGMPEREGCVGQVAALVIHGVDDYHVLFEYGEEARDYYLGANGCTNESVPDVSELHDRVVANRESHECADYQGCQDGLPVRWCEHSEGGYDGSTHGWPQFGGDAIWEFVSAL